MRKLIVVGVGCLILGLALGILVGRWHLERQWSQPAVLQRQSEAASQRSSGKDADAAPKVGALVLGPAPLARTRMVLAEITKGDPVVMSVGDVGNGDEGLELHLDLKNRGQCAVKSLSGTAYGFDAYGKPARMNKGGEHYVAFSEDDVKGLGPNEEHSLSLKLRHADIASLAVAHVDNVVCTDGTKWARGS